MWYLGQAVSLVTYRILTGGVTDATGRAPPLVMDLRWSVRSILRHPGFFLGVVVVLGLGLGANAAVFSVMDGTLKNSTWWGEPERTVAIWPGQEFSFGQLETYRYEQTVYRSLGGYVELAVALRTRDGESQSVNGVLITPALFRELAVQPTLGRALSDEDALFGVEPVAIIGEALWRRSFGADPSVLGTRVEIGGSPVTVVGIQGPGATAPGGRAELWIPLSMDPRDDDYWKAQDKTLVGVLSNGAGFGDAQADLMAYTRRLSDLFPMFYPPGWADDRATVARADEMQRRLISTPLMLLFSGTVLLLLLTALNVGNLLLGRAVDRRKELAIRAAIGAGRGRIVFQLLMEGLVLTALALVVGLATGSLGGEWVANLFVEEAIVSASSILSPAVMAFSLCIAFLAWLVLNGVPVLHFLKTQSTGLTVTPDSGAGVQRTLVTVQAALATLLLVSATLLVATVGKLRQVPLGFDPDGLITVELSTPEDRVASATQARGLYSRLAEMAGALPGVESAGLTGWLPLRARAPETPINLESDPVDPREAVRAPMQKVDPGFFETLGIQALEGRLLTDLDMAADTPSAILVNETLARMLWPNQSPVGQRIATDPHAWTKWAPVVGVVPDIRSGEIAGPTDPALYVSLLETPSRDVTLVLKTAGGVAEVMPMVRQVVQEADPLVPIRTVSSMEEVVRGAYATSWVMMGLLIILAFLATGLGAIGIYAVLAHHVSLNKREISVRIALGAPPGRVVGGVVWSGLTLSGIGILLGSLAAALSSRFLESLLFQVSAMAPSAFIAPAVALGMASVLAAWVPAARAGRLPPAQVLRSD
jgi:predicted permease